MKLVTLLRQYAGKEPTRDEGERLEAQTVLPFPIEPNRHSELALSRVLEQPERDEDLQEAFEERAAIMDHDGGLRREEAERRACEQLDVTLDQVVKNDLAKHREQRVHCRKNHRQTREYDESENDSYIKWAEEELMS